MNNLGQKERKGKTSYRHSPYGTEQNFQSLIVPSSEPVAYSFPSGEKLTDQIGPWWPLESSMSLLTEGFPYIGSGESVKSNNKKDCETHRVPCRLQSRAYEPTCHPNNP